MGTWTVVILDEFDVGGWTTYAVYRAHDHLRGLQDLDYTEDRSLAFN